MMRPSITIRAATVQDAEAMLAIYTPYVQDSVITFEESVPTVDDFTQRWHKVLEQSLPWLVAELEGKMIGYAYATPWKSRSAYRFSVETTIYLANDETVSGKGYGTALYQALFDQLRRINIHAIIGVITLPNPASIALHEKMGMQKAAHFSEVGYKCGQWCDVGYWHCLLPTPGS